MQKSQRLDNPSGRIYFRWQDQFHEALATLILLFIVFFMFCAVFWLSSHYAKPIDGLSMQPLINNYDVATGDIAIVSSIIRYTYDDILIVDMSKSNIENSFVKDKLLIKRVIALPGDTLMLQWNGSEYIFYLKKQGEDSFTPLYSNEYVQKMTNEDKANAFYNQTNWTNRIEPNFDGSITLPEGMIFFMGDNRDASYDCREFGPISTDCVVGVVESILKKDSFWNKVFSIITLLNPNPTQAITKAG